MSVIIRPPRFYSWKAKLPPDTTTVIDVSKEVPGDLVIKTIPDPHDRYCLLRVHKNVLMLASPVFRAMFSTNFAEGNRETPYDAENALEFLEDDFKPFSIMCKLLHCSKDRFDLADASRVAILADKYDCAKQVLQPFMVPLNAAFNYKLKPKLGNLGGFNAIQVAILARLAGDGHLFWRATRYIIAREKLRDKEDGEPALELADLMPEKMMRHIKWCQDEDKRVLLRGMKEDIVEPSCLKAAPGDRIKDVACDKCTAAAGTWYIILNTAFNKDKEWSVETTSVLRVREKIERFVQRVGDGECEKLGSILSAPGWKAKKLLQRTESAEGLCLVCFDERKPVNKNCRSSTHDTWM